MALVSPGPDRVVAPCTLFGSCGGCAFQELSYGAHAGAQRNERAALSWSLQACLREHCF